MKEERIAKIAFYAERARSNHFPISIQASLTDACFNKCVMCDHHLRKNKTEISIHKWISFLSEAKQRGVESVCYSGGDPLAYEHINRVMEEHIKLNIEFGFLTTGYLPPSIDISLLKHAKWVRCSLDAITPELYKRIRGGVSLEKVLASIGAMLRAGVTVGISATVQNENADEIIGIMEYARIIGIKQFWAKCVYDGTAENEAIDWKKIRRYGEELFEDFRTHDGEYHKFEKCAAVLYQMFVDAKGDVYPCCIMAGDTEIGSNMKPMYNISEYMSYEKNLVFSKLATELRPAECSKCQGRFTEINYVHEMLNKEKAFF